MSRLITPLAAALALLLPVLAAASHEFGTVQNFGPSLNAVCPLPEGIALDPETGNVYTTGGTSGAAASIHVLSPEGQLVDHILVPAGPGGTVFLLGELFVPGRACTFSTTTALLMRPRRADGS